MIRVGQGFDIHRHADDPARVLEFGSLTVLDVESGDPEANITTAVDAVWYTLVTMSTVGYGDQYPVTDAGRLAGSLIIVVGVGVFGTLTGFLANSFLTPSEPMLGIEAPARDLLVAYDDVDLPLGQIRIRRGGGSGGHRGLESVIAELASKQIPRLRIGVRGGEPWRDTAKYVLEPFEADEVDLIRDAIERSSDAVRMILRRNIGAAMNTYNQKPETPSPNGSDEEQPE